MQKVEVWVSISGDYCAFHEMEFYIVYDITNNKQLGDMSLEELELLDFDTLEYEDFEIREAYLIDDKYYVKWE